MSAKADIAPVSPTAGLASMWINSPQELGHLVHEARTRLGMSQADLGRAVGATRQWVMALERGNPSAELDRVLRALAVLGIRLNTGSVQPQPAADGVRKAIADLARDLAARTSSGKLRRISLERTTYVSRKRSGDT